MHCSRFCGYHLPEFQLKNLPKSVSGIVASDGSPAISSEHGCGNNEYICTCPQDNEFHSFYPQDRKHY